MSRLSQIVFLKAPNGFVTAWKCFLIIAKQRLRKALKGGQERGKEYIKTCRKKGCGRNAHTLPGMAELPLQQSFKENSGLHFPHTLKTPSYSLCRGSLVVSKSQWMPLMISRKILQQKFQPGLFNFPPNSQMHLPNFQWLVTSDPRLLTQVGLTQTQAPGRACGQDLARCHQCWWQPPLEPAALAAGRSTVNTNITLCSHGNQSVMFIIVSFLEEKKDIGLMKKNPRVPTGCAEAGQVFKVIAGTTQPRPVGKCSTQPCDGPWGWAGGWTGFKCIQPDEDSSCLACSVSLWS